MAIVSLPLGILVAFIVMHYQGVNANIMSLGGIAIAIGAMVDAAVVMIENAHKHLERWGHEHPGETLRGRGALAGDRRRGGRGRAGAVLLAADHHAVLHPGVHAGSAGRAAVLAAGLHQDLCDGGGGRPVGDADPGADGLPDPRPHSRREGQPAEPLLIAVYRPLLDVVLRVPEADAGAWPSWRCWRACGRCSTSAASSCRGWTKATCCTCRRRCPGLSAGKAAELLQQTDRLIKTVPEVASVYGKAGRAETATDPAPLEMFETTIQFKPREQWRPGMTQDKLVEELDRIVKVPGLANIWVPPIRNRIDMLATGIKSPVGVKVAGADLATIDRVTGEIESALKDVPGVSSALAERLTGGRYVDVTIDRDAAARFGMNIADVQSVIASAVGGDNIGETVEGLQRFPINVRYPREMRDSLEKLRKLPIVSDRGARLVLSDVAEIRITDGPPMLRSENARLSGWVYVDIRGRDLKSAVQDMQRVVAGQGRRCRRATRSRGRASSSSWSAPPPS